MIQFFTEEVDIPQIDLEKISAWLSNIANQNAFGVKAINYIFCSDDYLLDMNKTYLNHDYYTDIISFPMEANPIVADLFISLDRVKDNAITEKLAFDQELLRVMVHGLLHLVGFDDKTDDQKLIMRQKEDEALNQICL